jgi:hypothetical protein
MIAAFGAEGAGFSIHPDLFAQTDFQIVLLAAASVNLIWPLLIFSFGPTLW